MRPAHGPVVASPSVRPNTPLPAGRTRVDSAGNPCGTLAAKRCLGDDVMAKGTRRVSTLLVLVGWLSAASAGFWQLTAYSSTPGAPAPSVARWPGSSLVAKTPGRATLVMVAHPGCSCTRASLRELERLLTHLGD